MNTGILLLTHDKIAPALLETAQTILQTEDLNIPVVEAPADCDTEERYELAKRYISQLDEGQGVLILNDIYGATPFNIAHRLQSDSVIVLSGANLNMLLRAITYRNLPVGELMEKAREGGVNGVRYVE